MIARILNALASIVGQQIGGKTPLGAGLLETYNLIRRVNNKDPHTRFVVVVISDGRANQGMTDLPVKEEVAHCASLLLELKHTNYLVVDTEDKSGFMHADLAATLGPSSRQPTSPSPTSKRST